MSYLPYIIIIIQALLALLAALSSHIPLLRHNRLLTIVIVVVLILVLGVVQIFLQRQQAYKESTEATSGRLEFGSDIEWVALGTSGAKFEVAYLSRILAGVDRYKDDIQVRRQDGRLLISCVIRGKSGLRIAEITDNEWVLRPGSYWDRNYLNDAFEVKAPTGEVVLQIWTTGNTTRINAKLFDKDGRMVYLGNWGNQGVFAWQADLSRPPSHFPSIKPIFKYPSEYHLGEFVESRPPAQ